MKLYLAGEREGAETYREGDTTHWLHGVKRRLFSYWYHGAQTGNRPSRGLRATQGLGLDLFLDSGAFSAFSNDAVIDIDQYAAYLNQYGHWFSVCSSLDCIGDAKGSYDNLKALESNGVRPAPVFHCREDVAWLARYLDEGYDYILLGGMVPESTTYLLAWLDNLWTNYLADASGKPRVKVHGFGLTTPYLMQRYPWYSVDSSSWLMTGNYGNVAFVSDNGKLTVVAVSEDSPVAKRFNGVHYDRLPPPQRRAVDAWLEQYGVTAEQAKEHYTYRDRINAATYQRFEKFGTDRFVNRQRGLFDV